MNEKLAFIIFVSLVAIVSTIRLYYGFRFKHIGKLNCLSKELLKNENNKTRLIRILFNMCLIVYIIIFVNNPELFKKFSICFPLWLRWTGVFIGVISVFLFLWIHSILGKYWSPYLELREEHVLIKSGPYKLVRHPMYSAAFLLWIGSTLVMSNWLIVIANILAVLIMTSRIEKEEKMMIDRFGDEYKEYMKTTGAFVPGFFR